jgi:tRNA pseudouridine38-40 synthase
MRNVKLLVMYDGSPFFGFSKSGTQPTIASFLKKALEQLLGHPVMIEGASRTDRGVHALGQVANFFTPKPLPSLRALNGLLPQEIRVLDLSEMPLNFHPTLDARKKTYLYRLSIGSVQLPFDRAIAWHVPSPLSLEAMKEGASLLIGEHDFSSFCNQKGANNCHKIRKIDTISLVQPDLFHLNIEIEGPSFLYKMVRNIVGTLVEVGKGRLSMETVLKAQNRNAAGMTAPAHGLALKKVWYD